MAEAFQNSLDMLHFNGQQQPSVPEQSSGDDFDKILPGFSVYSDNSNQFIGTFLNENNNNQQLDTDNINTLIDLTINGIDPSTYSEDDLSGLIDDDSLQEILGELPKMEPQEHDGLSSLQQSTFIEYYSDQRNLYQPQSVQQPPSNVSVGSSPIEPQVNEIVLETHGFLNQQEEIYRAARQSKKQKNYQYHQSTHVGPVEYVMHSGDCQPCTTASIQHDYAYQQQLLEYDAEDSKKIQIRCPPRSKFRPRTQNESKISSHYLRCELNAEHEYPTINIPNHWFFASDMNLIEVALVGVDKQLHPYSLENKNSSNTFEENSLIFKQSDPGVIYFRLTNEDFQKGYKTFMIELIKAKQDNVITKEVIRSRQLEHSMLRFTRIFQMGKGNFQRDEGSTEYSNVMSEAYGDIDIEHMGPKYGPICGQEMVYIVLKGRVLKSDLQIKIKENHFGWEYSVENFTKNGNVIYFLMPAFPYGSQCETIKANIIIYFKGDAFYESPYLYKGSLDQELAALHISNSNTTMNSSSTSDSFNPLDFFTATNAHLNQCSRRRSSTKTPKRLGDKQKK